MIDREALPEYDWHVMLRDGSSFTVRAAYPQYGGLGPVNAESKPPVVLKDSANKVVFLAPEDAVGCVERRGRLDESEDPGETGELQAEVDRLREQLTVRAYPWPNTSTGTWAWPGTVTYNVPTMGAAGVLGASTLHFNFPAPGPAPGDGAEGDDRTAGTPVA